MIWRDAAARMEIGKAKAQGFVQLGETIPFGNSTVNGNK